MATYIKRGERLVLIATKNVNPTDDEITAGEYDILDLTADNYDNREITAYDFDTRAKAILI